jgi:hypothetical protein
VGLGLLQGVARLLLLLVLCAGLGLLLGRCLLLLLVVLGAVTTRPGLGRFGSYVLQWVGMTYRQQQTHVVRKKMRAAPQQSKPLQGAARAFRPYACDK